MKKFYSTALLFLFLGLVTSAKAQDMPLSQILIEGEGWEPVTGHEASGRTFGFTDGLSTDADGNLYFSDVRSGNAVYKVDLEGKTSEFIPNAEGISGLQWGADGRLYACVSRQREVVVFTKEGERTQLAAPVQPNDLVVTYDGNLYYTQTKDKEIRRISPDGEMTVVSKDVVTKPNGITLSTDQGILAVSDHGGKYVWTFRIAADGTLENAEPYMEMRTPVADPEIAKGDGMATDAHGRYYVTTAEGLQVFDPTGRLCGVIAKPQDENLVSVAFAGPDHAYLYVACGQQIFRRKTKTHGALFFQEPKPAEAPPK